LVKETTLYHAVNDKYSFQNIATAANNNSVKK